MSRCEVNSERIYLNLDSRAYHLSSFFDFGRWLFVRLPLDGIYWHTDPSEWTCLEADLIIRVFKVSFTSTNSL